MEDPPTAFVTHLHKTQEWPPYIQTHSGFHLMYCLPSAQTSSNGREIGQALCLSLRRSNPEALCLRVVYHDRVVEHQFGDETRFRRNAMTEHSQLGPSVRKLRCDATLNGPSQARQPGSLDSPTADFLLDNFTILSRALVLSDLDLSVPSDPADSRTRLPSHSGWPQPTSALDIRSSRVTGMPP